jgi:peroxiredoxin
MKYLYFFLVLIFVSNAFGQNNYKIDFEIENYESDTLLLAYFYADRQLIRDTILADENGDFSYAGTDTLESGVYILMFFPDRNYIQFLINENEAFFTLKGDYNDLSRPEFVGSRDNNLFYDYLDFIQKLKKEAADIGSQRRDAALLEKDTTYFDQQLEELDNRVAAYQDSLIQSFPNSVTTVLIKGNREIKLPEFEATGDELDKLRFYYYKNHFFDDIDLGDPTVLRTPFINNKLETYLSNLTVQMPDSIIVAVDHLLKQMEPSQETWKFYVAQFLNKYGKMQIIGMDAVYVHMVDTYYATGRTPWADEETLAKIIDNANKLRPILIGKTAPDVTLFDEAGNPVRLHDIESPYLVLMFWAPDCGHCKKSMPFFLEFNEKFKDRGVKSVAICTKHMDKTASCWEYVNENEMQGLTYNLADQHHKSRFQVLYNIRSTPQVFILDKDKKIILKRIAAEKLEEVMEEILANEKMEEK